MWRHRVCWIVLSFAFGGSAGKAEAQSTAAELSLEARFRSEYPREVERLMEFYRHFTMEVRLSQYKAEEESAYRVTEEKYARSGDRMRHIRDTVVSDHHAMPVGYREVRVADPDVSFGVAKEVGSSDYVTERIMDYAGVDSSMRLSAKPMVAPFSFLNVTIPEFMREETFKLRNVEASVDSETEKALIKVHWERPFSIGENRINQSGWFAFLPESSWALRELWVRQQGANMPADTYALIRCRIDYAGDTGRIPHVNSVRVWTEFYGHDSARGEVPLEVPVNIEEYDVLEFRTEDLADGEFTLAAFGIPTPGAPGSGRGRLFLWVNVGLILLVIGLLLYRLAKKRDEQTGRPRTI